VSKITLLYKAILPDVKASEFTEYIQLLSVINERIRSLSIDDYNVDDIKKDMEDLLDKSLATEKFQIEKRFELKDLSKIDFEALKNHFQDSRKNMQLESFKSAIEEKIDDMVKKNKSRKKFIDKLNLILADYNAGSKNVDKTFNELIALAQLLNEEERRAEIK
jgi:type I restriction enzyme R subunit